MRLISNLLYPFKLLAKIPYYKLGSYAFIVFLLYYALSVFVNYLYWAYFTTTSVIQFEVRQHFGNLEAVFSGHWTNFFDIIIGHIVILPKLFIYLYLVFFYGDDWFFNILNIFMYLVIIYMIYKTLQYESIRKYSLWVMVLWSVIMVFEPGNLYTLGPEHAMWLYLYFMVILDLFLFARMSLWHGYSTKRKVVLHGFVIVCLLLTFITFSTGLVIWPIIVFLLFMRKDKKLFIIYGVIFIVCVLSLSYFYYRFLHEYYEKFYGMDTDHWEILRYLFASFATPTSYHFHHTWELQKITTYLRSFYVMVLILWVIYFALYKPLFSRFFKKIYKRIFPLTVINTFFLGIFIFSLFNVLLLVVFKHYDDRAFSGTFIHARYYLNFNMLMISMFVLIYRYLMIIKRRWINIVLVVTTVLYVSLILIPYSSQYIYEKPKLHRNSVILLSMGITSKIEFAPLFRRFWDLEGYHIWQRTLLGINIYQYIDTSRDMNLVNNPHKWFVYDKVCLSCLWFLKTNQYTVDNRLKRNHIIHFVAVGHAPYALSQTTFITNKQGTIVGLGYLTRRNKIFVNIFSIWKNLYHPEIHYEGFFTKSKSNQSQVYTMWTIAFDRKHITPLVTFKLRPDHYVYFDIRPDQKLRIPKKKGNIQ